MQLVHAKMCFGIASALAGHPISPGSYRPHTLSIGQDLDTLLAEVWPFAETR